MNSTVDLEWVGAKGVLFLEYFHLGVFVFYLLKVWMQRGKRQRNGRTVALHIGIRHVHHDESKVSQIRMKL